MSTLTFALPADFQPLAAPAEDVVELGRVPLAGGSIAALVLAVRPAPPPGDGMTATDVADGVARALTEAQPFASVERRELAGGPAVVVRRAGGYRLPGGQVETVSVQVLFPTPGLDELVVLDVSTSHTEHAAVVAALTLAVADTVRFSVR